MAHPTGGGGTSFIPGCTFDQAYRFVSRNDHFVFISTSNHTVTAQIGKTEHGDRAIMFPGHGNVCSACWGYRLNCSGARIGHCVEALARQIGPVR